MAKETMSKLGIWAFIVGLILAIVIALVSGGSPQPWALIVLVILGVLVGILNISASEMQMFLIATIGFLISFQVIGGVVATLGWAGMIASFFQLMSVFMAAAAVVVSIIALYKLAKD